MIVKNEEHNIVRALSWGKGIIKEQIVVDTGSEDRTAEIAKQMGAKVYHYDWNDNFAAAKNYALKKAKGNWIVFLDADEFVLEEDTKKLQAFINQVHTDFRVKLITLNIAHLDQEGRTVAVAPQHRVFRNDPKIRYRYRIHEELYETSGVKLPFVNAGSEIMILHTGYTENEKAVKQKGKRNIELLQKQLEETPTDGKFHMYLGDAYNIAGEETKAIESYQKVLWDDAVQTPDAAAFLRAGLQFLNLLVKKPIDETEEFFFRICKTLKDRGLENHPDLDYLEGLWRLKAGNMQEAARLFECALQKMEQYKGAEVVRISAGLKLVCNTIAKNALEQGEAQKAVQYATTVLRMNQYSADGLDVLLKAFLTEWKEGMSIDPYWNFLCKIYEKNRTEDLQFLCKAAKASGFQSLEEYVSELMQ